MARKLILQGHQVTMVCGSYSSGETGIRKPFKGGKREGIVEGIHVIEFELAYSNHDNFQRVKTFDKFSMLSIKVVFSEQYDLVFATSTPLTANTWHNCPLD